MLNQFLLVGRLLENVALNDEEAAIVTIVVPRNYKNANGEYENDFITCQLNGPIANNTAEYCKKGDIVGIKGRIESIDNIMILKAEKVTFLSSKKEESEGK